MRVLYNARIYRQTSTLASNGGADVTALLIDHGKVVCTGSDADILGRYENVADKLDLRGRTVWPGLTDAHIHLDLYASALQMIDCETSTRAECLRRVAERAARTPEGKWIRGHGWNQNDWPEGFGSASLLDNAAPGHPVFLTAKSLHAAWANSAALQAAGITRTTPDPQDGVIGRDDEGNPTGILFEAAMSLVMNAIPSPTLGETVQAIETAQANLWQVGITGVHDYDRRQCFASLQILQQQGRLKLRVLKSIPLEDLSHAVELGLRSGYGNDILRIGPVKLFADGALGPRTAAMLQPYENQPENTGILMLDNEQIFEYGQQAAAGGFNLAIHAIGDRANHEVLTGYAHLRRYEAEQGLPHLRHRIEHVQVLHPQDYGRLSELGVIASVQPIHATSDMFTADRHWGSRSAGAYAFRTLLARGTSVCFGSDAPVESPNPFLGLHAAVNRRRSDGSPGPDGWYPDQRLSLAEALRGFTLGPAFAAGLEGQLGSLVPGKLADLIILEQDPFQLPPDELHSLQPVATMVGGEWVWQKEA